MRDCELLTFVYTETRYPDTGFWEWTKEEAEKDIAVARRVLKWTAERIS